MLGTLILNERRAQGALMQVEALNSEADHVLGHDACHAKKRKRPKEIMPVKPPQGELSLELERN